MRVLKYNAENKAQLETWYHPVSGARCSWRFFLYLGSWYFQCANIMSPELCLNLSNKSIITQSDYSPLLAQYGINVWQQLTSQNESLLCLLKKTFITFILGNIRVGFMTTWIIWLSYAMHAINIWFSLNHDKNVKHFMQNYKINCHVVKSQNLLTTQLCFTMFSKYNFLIWRMLTQSNMFS